jgi:hypothetical protein
MKLVNRLEDEPSFDDLLPATEVDHLLPEDQRPLAREAFEALGREMDRRLTRQALYSIFYESARDQIAAGMSQDAIRAEMTSLADTDDELFAAIVREAYEDALAGRPPRDPA